MRRRSRFRVSALLLAVVLSAAPAFARGHQPPPPAAVRGLFSSLWQALGGLFPALPKGRDTIAPNGATSTAPAGSETDGRAGQDPNG